MSVGGEGVISHCCYCLCTSHTLGLCHICLNAQAYGPLCCRHHPAQPPPCPCREGGEGRTLYDPEEVAGGGKWGHDKFEALERGDALSDDEHAAEVCGL